MNLQAQRDLSIAGDVVGRDKITINITRGLDELPTRYDSRVQNFLEYYLGAKDHPAPFGGRAADLASLDAWLDDPAALSYASLIAPAGRGKSALLAHWVTRLALRPANGTEAVHVVYFPISIRFNTNLETIVFASLAARIAHVFGEKVTYTPDTSQYRGVFSDYLRRIPPNGGRVLVVLDGLDEAAGWEAGADLFPTVPPGHLRVIVAARPLALDRDETAWLNRLGWETPNRAQRISLAGLDREGVRDVLSQMGNPLDALATKIDLISRLYELSAGDPLLVRLYVEALLPQGAQAATLTSEDLAKLQPGLEAYFKRWFEEQQKLWGAAKPLQDKTVRGLLNLCAAALGPLKKDDVLALAPDIFEDSGLLDEAAAAVNRFIIGDGLASGYVFSHPRLAEYFAGKLTERERAQAQARFLQYARDTLTALENKTLLPKNAPAYVVQYYGAHLAQAKAPATDFYALICESWLRAWEWLEGTPTGFLNDAERAWQQAEVEGPAALGQQIRAALCFASVTSLSANISNDLLVACVKAGVISPALGLIMARQKPDPKDRAVCLAAIAEFLPSESCAIMSEALSAARAISYEESRAEVLGALAPRLPENLLGEALSAARAISYEGFSVKALGALAPRLPEREQEEVLKEALSAARAISDERSRSLVLVELAPRLPVHEQIDVLREAVTAARAISDELSLYYVLLALAPRLPEREQVEVLGEALSAARAIFDESSRAYALEALAPWLLEHEQAEVLGEALSAARAISDERSRAKVLGAIAPRLPEREQAEVLGEALSLARVISDEESRALVLVELAPGLPEGLLGEALSEARAISDERFRAYVLDALAPRLPEREQVEALGEALSAACAISDEWSRTFALKVLTLQLPENMLGEVLSAARAISDEGYRANILVKLAPRLPKREQAKVLYEALSAARAISNQESRAYVLGELAPRLPEREQAEVLGETLSAARAISDEESRARVLGELAPRLSEPEQANVLGEALSLARTISDEESRAKVLMQLAPRLPEHEHAKVLREALSAARAISDEESRAEILEELTPHLSESLLGEALTVALAISDELFRACVLRKLAPRLPESLLREALSAAYAISDEGFRAEVLMELAPRLPEHEHAKVLREALSSARAISDEESRTEILGELASRLPEREQLNVFGEALSSARAISNEESRAKVLRELASRLPEHEHAKVLREALSSARAISDERSRSYALEALALRLPVSLLGEALSVARAISSESSRARALGALAMRLPEREQVEALDEALSVARAISDEWFRARVLGELALWLPEHEQVLVFEEALSAACTISNESSRTDVLGKLAPSLPESLLGEALQMTKTLCHADKIIAVLSSLALRWSAVCRSTQKSEFEELSATLRAFARTERPQFLQAMQALLPVIAEQGGVPALRETVHAIVDTAKWWP